MSFYKDRPKLSGIHWKDFIFKKEQVEFWKSIDNHDMKLMLLDVLLDDDIWNLLHRWREEIKKHRKANETTSG